MSGTAAIQQRPNPGSEQNLQQSQVPHKLQAEPVTWADTFSSCYPEGGDCEDEEYSCKTLASLKPCWDGLVSYLNDCWKCVCDWIASFSKPEDPHGDETKPAYKIDTLRKRLNLKVNPQTSDTADSAIFGETELCDRYIRSFTDHYFNHKAADESLISNFVEDYDLLPNQLQAEIRAAYVDRGDLRNQLPHGLSQADFAAAVDALIARDSTSQQIKEVLMRWIKDATGRAQRT